MEGKYCNYAYAEGKTNIHPTRRYSIQLCLLREGNTSENLKRNGVWVWGIMEIPVLKSIGGCPPSKYSFFDRPEMREVMSYKGEKIVENEILKTRYWNYILPDAPSSAMPSRKETS